jgi:hypothetical protein
MQFEVLESLTLTATTFDWDFTYLKVTIVNEFGDGSSSLYWVFSGFSTCIQVFLPSKRKYE